MLLKICDYNDEIRDYISKEPNYNTYIISDVEMFGLNSDIISLYADYKNNDIQYIIMKYGNSFVIYSQVSELIDINEIRNFFGKFSNEITITGKTEIINKISCVFDNAIAYDNSFSVISPKSLNIYYLDDSRYSIKKECSVESIIRIYSQIDEYKGKYRDKNVSGERIRKNYLNGRYYGMEYSGELVSIVSSVAESSKCAMISEVGTLKEHRNKGLSKIIVSNLCKDLFDEGREQLSIFYDNPIAEQVYKLIGFRKIGNYSILKVVL